MANILVIEDDVEFNELLCMTLNKKGYAVLSAPNGKIGIDLYQKHLPDLVITDIVMPEQDGIEVICTLKKISPDVKIIAISGGGSLGSGQDYIESAKTMFNIEYSLVKPFPKEQLLQIIQKILTV